VTFRQLEPLESAASCCTTCGRPECVVDAAKALLADIMVEDKATISKKMLENIVKAADLVCVQNAILRLQQILHEVAIP
jgi:hypothetical protein